MQEIEGCTSARRTLINWIWSVRVLPLIYTSHTSFNRLMLDDCAYTQCENLSEVELPEGLEKVGKLAFFYCISLRRVAIPLKDGMLGVGVFKNCKELPRVDLVGTVHKTISYLHLNSWRNEMDLLIRRINVDLVNLDSSEKTEAIQEWIRTVLERIEHYKIEHIISVNEAMTLLKLALWKIKLDGTEGGVLGQEKVRTTRLQWKRARLKDRHEKLVTSCASIVIKNVIPFLMLP